MTSSKNQQTIDGIMSEVMGLKEGLEQAISEGVTDTGEYVRDEAARRMSVSFNNNMLSDSKGVSILNDTKFPQADPGRDYLASEVLDLVVTGDGVRKTFYVGIGNIVNLDALADREGSIRVRVVSKKVELPSLLGDIGLRKGQLYRFKELTIRGRKNRGEGGGPGGWHLWRALEYGVPPTKEWARVTVRTVRAVRGQFISFGPYVTFMTSKPQYWMERISPEIGWVEYPSYWGGDRPLESSFTQGRTRLWPNIVKRAKDKGFRQ